MACSKVVKVVLCDVILGGGTPLSCDLRQIKLRRNYFLISIGRVRGRPRFGSLINGGWRRSSQHFRQPGLEVIRILLSAVVAGFGGRRNARRWLFL